MNRQRNGKHTLLLVGLAAGMFAFAFSLVPLYNIFCEITGLNGKTSTTPSTLADVNNESSRHVTLHFMAKVGRGLPWDVRPVQEQLTVRVGEMQTTHYYARNRADNVTAGQAVPSVAPGRAAQYLKKVECFCFTRQELSAGQETNMPVRFFVSPDLPEDINTLSLSYTVFPQQGSDVVAQTGGMPDE
ncbi:MAG: cytochrome c oxidase assembly protein [Gammaproteobacteria bacterium]|nr:cytochrome c oxidase assembly protein [Gammaproteobacteria bacterium]